jgi:hypothetical protein
VVDGGDPTASPAVVIIHAGAGRFRMTCLPQRAIEAPLRARDVVIVRQVPPGGGLLVERCLRGPPTASPRQNYLYLSAE